MKALPPGAGTINVPPMFSEGFGTLIGPAAKTAGVAGWLRLRMIGPVVALIALALVTTALAGGPGTPKLKGAKHREGPYKRELSVAVQGPRDLYVKVKSTADFQQDATLSQRTLGQRQDYKIRWFRAGVNISDDVRSAGHDFTLSPDRPRIFRVRVAPRVTDPDSMCLFANVTVTNPATGRNGPFFAVNDADVCVP